jgi:2-polyprenyl-6-methoxyphenol hydroxylase-like FAD-dependent oxidoreductase
MTMQAINDTYDAVIVGARCAGAATAMLLASFGLRVLLFDKSRYGTDTLSTHALMRPAVLLLHRWGLTDRLEAEGTPRITRTSFLYADNERREQVEVDIKPRHGVDTLYAPVPMLDLLHADGRVAGVRLRDESGRARDVRAGIVIGADGRRSGVARLAGSTPYMLGRHMTSSAVRSPPTTGTRCSSPRPRQTSLSDPPRSVLARFIGSSGKRPQTLGLGYRTRSWWASSTSSAACAASFASPGVMAGRSSVTRAT